ncbi:MAG: DUF3108 domain-containing protein [Acidiferrobacterales bacterium]
MAAGIFLAMAVTGMWLGIRPASAGTLPDNMKLAYSVHYGAIPVGTSTRTLHRQTDGTYRYTLHLRPAGVARMFTHIEWYEKGHFRVVNDQVLPLEYLKYRTGAADPRREQAKFEWDKGRIVYSKGGSDPLPPGAQDGNSIIFELMLHPPVTPESHEVRITTGTKLITYDYRYLRRETIQTALGKLDTIVVHWAERSGKKPGDVFTAWLATDKHDVPVKIVAKQGDRTGTMLIQSASGI